MRDHRKLKVFSSRRRTALAVYRATHSFPPSEEFGLESQMREAAVSTPCNIVEGCARNSEREYLRFLNIAFGSAQEVSYQISLSARPGCFGPNDPAALSRLSAEVCSALNGLIRSLK